MGWMETHRRLARRKARGAERLLEPILYPMSLLYGTAAWFRNRIYDLHILSSQRIGAAVISVGGLSAGGTGKTPFAALVAQSAHRAGCRPLLVARGYGAPKPRCGPRLLTTGREGTQPTETWESAGEEALLLARVAPGIPVAVAQRREEALAAARRAGIGVDALIIDGGFQYRRLSADLSIVMVDAAEPPGRARLLPLGDMRESWAGLRRAHLIVLHRAELCPERGAWEAFIARYAPAVACIWCQNLLGAPYPLADRRGAERLEWRDPPGKRWGVWTALGHPESFLQGLQRRAIKAAWVRTVRDHAGFGPPQVTQLRRAAREEHLDGFLVTEKDAVKIEPLVDQLPPIFVVPAYVSLATGEAELQDALTRVLGRGMAT